MSMNTVVYLGPFIVAQGIDQSLIAEHESRVMNGRGNAQDQDGCFYIIPNREVPGLTVDRNFESNPVLAIDELMQMALAKDMRIFADFAVDFIRDVKQAGGEIEWHWGIVCGVF